MLTTNELRNKFLKYFEENGHTVVRSSSLIPDNDPTLLFTNSGMVQFKNTFLGSEKRDYVRATTAQKCVRAGGKHNDLENVGHTARHHTFFEMLGNFSFGDYFKAEAIPFAWNFLTKVIGLPEDRLVVTIFHTDEEAFDIWHNVVGLPEERIIRIASDDNFWSMGDTGPCGPCTEIFYDHGEEVWGGLPGSPEEDGDRYIEIWNVVFMQYNRQADGTDVPLKQTGVDTGCGLERLSAILQGKHNNFEIDTFVDLITGIQKELGIKETKENQASFRVIADHLRSMSFLIADGLVPSNEGRGYVLRRIMRRAMRHANLLGAKEAVIYKCVKHLAKISGEDYPELVSAQKLIEETIKTEETNFNRTLDKGIKILEEESKHLKEGDFLKGEVAFKLYDTYGFPLDLTQDILKAKGIKVNQDDFDKLMDEQKQKARAAGLGGAADSKLDTVWFDIAANVDQTEFIGYSKENSISKIKAIVNEEGQMVNSLQAGQTGYIVLDKTPCYAESGGQIGDSGYIKNNDETIAKVADTQKVVDGKIFYHKIEDLKSTLSVEDVCFIEIDIIKRRQAMKNHTAAHLFHKALQEIVGENCFQKGTMVDHERMRFDFSSNRPLTAEEIKKIECRINSLIMLGGKVDTQEVPQEEAFKMGATALFGEKYGNIVRVVDIESTYPELTNNFRSIELCGGTHVSDISEIGSFKITSEASIAAGIRRIEALTGLNAIRHLSERDYLLSGLELSSKFKAEELEERFKFLNSKVKKLEKELVKLKVNTSLNPESLISSAKQVKDVKLITATVEDIDLKEIRDVVFDIKNRSSDIVIALGVNSEKGSNLVLGVSKELIDKHPANELIKIAGEPISLRGGGNKEIATAGGAKVDSFNSAFDNLENRI